MEAIYWFVPDTPADDHPAPLHAAALQAQFTAQLRHCSNLAYKLQVTWRQAPGASLVKLGIIVLSRLDSVHFDSMSHASFTDNIILPVQNTLSDNVLKVGECCDVKNG